MATIGSSQCLTTFWHHLWLWAILRDGRLSTSTEALLILIGSLKVGPWMVNGNLNGYLGKVWLGFTISDYFHLVRHTYLVYFTGAVLTYLTASRYFCWAIASWGIFEWYWSGRWYSSSSFTFHYSWRLNWSMLHSTVLCPCASYNWFCATLVKYSYWCERKSSVERLWIIKGYGQFSQFYLFHFNNRWICEMGCFGASLQGCRGYSASHFWMWHLFVWKYCPTGDSWFSNTSITTHVPLEFQVLSGAVPYRCLTLHQVMRELSEGRHPPRPIEPPIADNDWDFMTRCWGEPQQRPTTIEISEYVCDRLQESKCVCFEPFRAWYIFISGEQPVKDESDLYHNFEWLGRVLRNDSIWFSSVVKELCVICCPDHIHCGDFGGDLLADGIEFYISAQIGASPYESEVYHAELHNYDSE